MNFDEERTPDRGGITPDVHIVEFDSPGRLFPR